MRAILVRSLAIVLALLVRPAMGDSFTLPLAGYFHPGRAMPVQWQLDKPGPIDLSSADAISVHVDSTDHPTGVLPILKVDDAEPVIVWKTSTTTGQIALHPLEDSQRLVVSFVDSPPVIFPGEDVRTIRLDISSLKGPAGAWETADAIIFTRAQWQSLSGLMRNELLTLGPKFFVSSFRRNDLLVDWQRAGNYSVTAADVRMPPPIDADAYGPTYAWAPGRSWDFRRQIFIFAAIYACAMAGIVLLPWRAIPILVVVISIILLPIFTSWNRGQSPVAVVMGQVMPRPSSTPFFDTWEFQFTHLDSKLDVDISNIVRPICADTSQWRDSDFQFTCDAAGNPIHLSGKLFSDMPLAIVRRAPGNLMHLSLQPRPITSPLGQLVMPSIYPGFAPEAQSTFADDAHWPSIIISRINARFK